MSESDIYFVVSDVHGHYMLLRNALEQYGFDLNNPHHKLVSCGDLLDRGAAPLKCLQFVNDLYSKGRAILIRGNHEDLMDEMIERGYAMQHDLHNGTIDTVLELTGHSRRELNSFDSALAAMVLQKDYETYRTSLVDFAELGNYIFVHGWIPCDRQYKKGSRELEAYTATENWKQGDWSVARWVNGMDAWNNGIRLENKTIVCGHFHTSWGHSKIDYACSEWGKDAMFTPFTHKGIIALDACTAYSGQINCLVISDIYKEYFI